MGWTFFGWRGLAETYKYKLQKILSVNFFPSFKRLAKFSKNQISLIFRLHFLEKVNFKKRPSIASLEMMPSLHRIINCI